MTIRPSLVAGPIGIIVAALSLAGIANTFAASYVAQEQYVYFWDFSTYWIKYIEISASLVESPMAALGSVLSSIRTDQYNPLPVLPLVPVELLFGSSRLTYILAVTNLYLLPSAIVTGLLAVRICQPGSPRQFLPLLVLATASVLMLHPLWAPALRGFPDVVGIAVIGVILLLHFSKPLADHELSNLVATGLLLCLLVLLRRWYLFWVVAFFLALAPAHALDIYQRHGIAWRHYANAARNAVIIGLTFTLSLFAVATPFAAEALLTDYSDIYSAYRSNTSLLDAAARLFSYFGVTMMFGGLVGLAWLAIRRATRLAGSFLIVQSLIAFALFARTQDFGVHHYYLLMPGIALGIAVVATGLAAQVGNALGRVASVGLLFAFLLAGSGIVFVPGAAGLSHILGIFTPKVRYYPLVRNDIDVLDRLLDRLDALQRQRPGHVYVLASSVVLNSSVLQNRCRFGSRPRSFCDRILSTNDVDKRDGFPRQFLLASYVVVTNPTQYHLRPQDQRVVGVLAREVMEGNGIGTSFQRLSGEFKLDNGASASLHTKVRPLESSDLDALSREFASYYPDRHGIFEPTRN